MPFHCLVQCCKNVYVKASHLVKLVNFKESQCWQYHHIFWWHLNLFLWSHRFDLSYSYLSGNSIADAFHKHLTRCLLVDQIQVQQARHEMKLWREKYGDAPHAAPRTRYIRRSSLSSDRDWRSQSGLGRQIPSVSPFDERGEKEKENRKEENVCHYLSSPNQWKPSILKPPVHFENQHYCI